MIKKLGALFFLLSIILPGLISAQQTKFDIANEYLTDREYRQALSIYHEIAAEDYHSGALWLNMGIAYTRLDSLGKAKFYFLKAKNYPETGDLASESLIYIEDRLSRRSAVLPPLPWQQFLDWQAESFGIRGLVITALFLFIMASGFFIGSWFYREKSTLLLRTGTGTLLFSLFFFTCSLIIHYQNQRFGTGVVVERQNQFYSSPDPESATISTAYEGYQLSVDYKMSEDYEDWFYIRTENGQYGWIPRDAVMVF